MDNILQTLQGKSFHLSDTIFNFLSGRYSFLTLQHTMVKNNTVKKIILLHRKQFLTEEYLKSRIINPSTGTIDHLHAEITADTAVRIGRKAGYTGYALELLRAAGHLHDADRSFPLTMTGGEKEVRHDLSAYRKYKELHAENSAKRAKELIEKTTDKGGIFPDSFTYDLTYLIRRHELGGKKKDGTNIIAPSAVDSSLNLNDLTDIVTDADSLSYFDANILTNWEECGKNKTLLAYKVYFMYDRMTPMAQNELQTSIIYSKQHILGHPSSDNDIQNIREVLLSVKRTPEWPDQN